ncbi:mitotic spindle assembly checkpoint protein MAD1 [Reticulomyxa filosa]|uniref:Mitotic spindle assembly checkpoint protein MAD1 n=1 Tax=Reticulomyxa filosa TaxID=46433 RepID=X6P0B2_RETFI|nr:mitotic spindle assembly checkpoint protein MAD1 [Reticulomyxa filosa]|eukprot:ETO31578.1 mitotic spindle assembly checkpoint protein MAD1 [Reticulomyxa filosa]
MQFNLIKKKKKKKKLLGSGEFNQSTTKVLHLKKNFREMPTQPSTTSKAEVESLRAQVEQYKVSLKELSEGSSDLQKFESAQRCKILENKVDNLKDENNVLRGDLDKYKTILERTKKIFADKLTEYRKAVYKLTGWLISIVPSDDETLGNNNNSTHPSNNEANARPIKEMLLELKHLWMQTPNDRIVIGLRPKDQIAVFFIRDTPFMRSVDPKILKSFETKRSSPYLLSAITMQLYKE